MQTAQKVPQLLVQGQGSKDQRLHISTSDIPNIGVDVRFETLKQYLDQISGAVNQHAIKINSLEKDLENKVETRKLADSFERIGEGVNLFDNEFLKICKQLMGTGRFENTQSQLENTQNRLINRHLMQGHGLTYIFQKFKKVDPHLDDIDKLLKDKVSIDIFHEKKKKHKKLLKSEITLLRDQLESRFKELDRRATELINQTQEKCEDVEKKTLWRLSDLEQHVKLKINQQYVDDSMRKVEETMRREFAQYFVDSERNVQMYNELKQQLKYNEEQLSDKIRANKKSITDLEEASEKKYSSKVLFEERAKITNDKLYDFSQRLKDLEKKSDYSVMFDKQTNRMKVLEEKLIDLDLELKRKFEEIMLKEQQDEFRKKQEESLHKLCTLEGYIKNLHCDMDKYKNKVLELESEFMHRLEKAEQEFKMNPFGGSATGSGGEKKSTKFNIDDIASKHEVTGALDVLKLELSQKFQEMVDSVYRDMKKQNDEERMGKLFTVTNELQRRHEALESKYNKTSREMDMYSIVKQLRDKAENDQVRRDFAVQETKLNQMHESIGFIKKDIENMGKIYQKIIASIQDGTLNTVEEQLVVMSKRLLPASCISCHNGQMTEKQKLQAKTIKIAQKNDGYVLGNDKRPYKVDMNYLINSQKQLQELQFSQGHHQGQPSMPLDQDIFSVGGAQIFLDKSTISNSMPNVKKGKNARPSTAKINRSESQGKKLIRPDSAKE